MKNCHVCNQLCEDNAELCPICGAMLVDEDVVEESESENSEEERKIEPVLLAVFEDLVTAEIFKDVLTDNKIPYSDSQEDTMRVVFGGSFASEEIYVDQADYDKAKELYDEFMANEPEFSDEDLFF
ncbi:MAG: DUF2007 domain-containing protein [Clostridia bacterium]|nr:DUF2007 domain-containing protein [Clostridia bacterium]MBR6563928.1 DUF2007 domain-containing protein [Clostridia bacterium]MBR6741403.1 DUF2007 domain-containing protein [Clostridia bacterium]